MKTVLFLLFAVLFVSCASYSFKENSKIGIGGNDKDGNSYFCVYDQKVEKGKYDMKATCSMTVRTEKGIFECAEISLEKIGKNFNIETDCKLILFLSDNVAVSNPKSVLTSV